MRSRTGATVTIALAAISLGVIALFPPPARLYDGMCVHAASEDEVLALVNHTAPGARIKRITPQPIGGDACLVEVELLGAAVEVLHVYPDGQRYLTGRVEDGILGPALRMPSGR